jgi:hypothetical protein
LQEKKARIKFNEWFVLRIKKSAPSLLKNATKKIDAHDGLAGFFSLFDEWGHSKRIYRNACLVAGEFAERIGRCNPGKFLKLFTLSAASSQN